MRMILSHTFTLTLFGLLLSPFVISAQEDLPFITPPELIPQDQETPQTNPLSDDTLLFEETPLSYYLSTCTPNRDIVEINQEVIWSYEISGAYTHASWSGETLLGATEQEVVTSYPNQGAYSATINVTRYDGATESIPCGTVSVIKPPLSLQCSVSESFVSPESCVTWSVDISTSSAFRSINWLGHHAVDPQTNESFQACYPQKGSYRADVQVTTSTESRTVYCGSVTVMDNPPSPENKKDTPTSSFLLASGETLEGYCSADQDQAAPDEHITWTAHMNTNIPHQSISWSGYNMDGRNGLTQKVVYEDPGSYTARMSVRTNDGELYTFPCSNSVMIDDSYGSHSTSNNIFWIRTFIILLLVIIWIPGIVYIRKTPRSIA